MISLPNESWSSSYVRLPRARERAWRESLVLVRVTWNFMGVAWFTWLTQSPRWPAKLLNHVFFPVYHLYNRCDFSYNHLRVYVYVQYSVCMSLNYNAKSRVASMCDYILCNTGVCRVGLHLSKPLCPSCSVNSCSQLKKCQAQTTVSDWLAMCRAGVTISSMLFFEVCGEHGAHGPSAQAQSVPSAPHCRCNLYSC